MIKILLIFIFIVKDNFPESVQSFEKISKEIQEKCTCKTCKLKGATFNEIRVRLYDLGKLNFVNINSDTLFTVENYELETGNYYGQIWTSKGTLKYIFNGGNFGIENEKLFTKYTIDLINK